MCFLQYVLYWTMFVKVHVPVPPHPRQFLIWDEVLDCCSVRPTLKLLSGYSVRPTFSGCYVPSLCIASCCQSAGFSDSKGSLFTYCLIALKCLLENTASLDQIVPERSLIKIIALLKHDSPNHSICISLFKVYKVWLQ